MSRTSGNTTMELPVSGSKQKLSILVENQGRISEQKFLNDRKVIRNWDLFQNKWY